jgi:hypothetical protein
MNKTPVKCNDGIWRENPDPSLIREPRSYDDDGFLSRYGFHCGCIEKEDIGPVILTMWEEHQTFHVRGTLMSGWSVERLFWEVFDARFEEAKRFYLAKKKELEAKWL